MTAKMTSIRFDEKTTDLLEQLKTHYGASSKAEILRKSIALLSIASEADDENAKLIVKGKDFEKEIIVR